jgi:hypothetical protein
MKQKFWWVCEVCGLSGATEAGPHADTISAVYAIADHHDRLAKRLAPLCRFDLYKVKVRNPRLMDEYEWNRLVASIEGKVRV